MAKQKNTGRIKRLKFVRGLMYLDTLLLILSLALLDFRDLSWGTNSGSYTRMVILVLIFGILYVTEKNLNRYLRKDTNDGEMGW